MPSPIRVDDRLGRSDASTPQGSSEDKNEEESMNKKRNLTIGSEAGLGGIVCILVGSFLRAVLLGVRYRL